MRTDKQQWRERIALARDSLTPEERAERSKRLGDTVVRELLAPLGARLGRPLTLCAYGAFRSEADPGGLIDWCAERGHRTVAPRVVTGEGPGLELRVLSSERDWKPGRWGVPEPDPERCELYPIDGAVDAILVPGLAFDDFGGRLGYGGGYYDRLYEARRKNAGSAESTIWIGFAFGVQRLEERLPKEEHDLPLDGLATENGIRWYDRRRIDGQADAL